MLVMGIDPGVKGGIALVSPYEDDRRYCEAVDMPVYDLLGKPAASGKGIRRLIEEYRPSFIVVERVSAMRGWGSSTIFSFGRNVGIALGAVHGSGVPFGCVSPQKWKKHFGLNKDKGASRARASELFPLSSHMFERVKDDGRAEAALIAQYHIEVGVGAIDNV